MASSDIKIDPPPRSKKKQSQFDALIETWNAMSPATRQAERSICAKRGHDLRNVVDKRGTIYYVICKRCREYQG